MRDGRRTHLQDPGVRQQSRRPHRAPWEEHRSHWVPQLADAAELFAQAAPSAVGGAPKSWCLSPQRSRLPEKRVDLKEVRTEGIVVEREVLRTRSFPLCPPIIEEKNAGTAPRSSIASAWELQRRCEKERSGLTGAHRWPPRGDVLLPSSGAVADGIASPKRVFQRDRGDRQARRERNAIKGWSSQVSATGSGYDQSGRP